MTVNKKDFDYLILHFNDSHYHLEDLIRIDING